jgi:hypothetical protein
VLNCRSGKIQGRRTALRKGECKAESRKKEQEKVREQYISKHRFLRKAVFFMQICKNILTL